ncbi:MAG: AAA family ATPase [Ruminococcus flavefaciens]|nr:AAA family ATPase [Ruminococcus flavefaciens]
MLKRFSVINFKNFEDKLVLDLSNANNYGFSEKAVENGMVKDALVYGENGSGKTNLGYAIFDIILHLTDKEKKIGAYRLYRNLNWDTPLVEFEYVFEFSGIELIYRYKKTAPQKLELEQLLINGEEKLFYDYVTHKAVAGLHGAETLNTDLTDRSISFAKYVQNNTILDENDIDNRVFRQFFSFVDRMLWFSSLEKNEYQGFTNGSELLAEGIIKRNKVADFQQFLSRVGINYEFEVIELEGEKDLFCRYGERSVKFFRIASRGTCSLTLFYYWLIQMEKASFVFIDEFDAFYHNNLAEKVVRELLDLKNVQAILTTHNTDIMTNDLLRPDCYFQLRNGTIRSFSDSTQKELRKAHNLQKMYHAGAFDGEEDSDNIRG